MRKSLRPTREAVEIVFCHTQLQRHSSPNKPKITYHILFITEQRKHGLVEWPPNMAIITVSFRGHDFTKSLCFHGSLQNSALPSTLNILLRVSLGSAIGKTTWSNDSTDKQTRHKNILHSVSARLKDQTKYFGHWGGMTEGESECPAD